jgi:hypothetical protein
VGIISLFIAGKFEEQRIDIDSEYLKIKAAILRLIKSKCGNARYIQNTFTPPFHVYPEAIFAGKSAEQPSECRLYLLS